MKSKGLVALLTVVLVSVLLCLIAPLPIAKGSIVRTGIWAAVYNMTPDIEDPSILNFNDGNVYSGTGDTDDTYCKIFTSNFFLDSAGGGAFRYARVNIDIHSMSAPSAEIRIEAQSGSTITWDTLATVTSTPYQKSFDIYDSRYWKVEYGYRGVHLCLYSENMRYPMTYVVDELSADFYYERSEVDKWSGNTDIVSIKYGTTVYGNVGWTQTDDSQEWVIHSAYLGYIGGQGHTYIVEVIVETSSPAYSSSYIIPDLRMTYHLDFRGTYWGSSTPTSFTHSVKTEPGWFHHPASNEGVKSWVGTRTFYPDQMYNPNLCWKHTINSGFWVNQQGVKIKAIWCTPVYVTPACLELRIDYVACTLYWTV